MGILVARSAVGGVHRAIEQRLVFEVGFLPVVTSPTLDLPMATLQGIRRL
jgi:hypothetical protein